MATLEDKILGEKLEYYCSSGEEDEADSDDDGEFKDAVEGTDVGIPSAPQGGHYTSETTSNTGPKGVIKDWQRFKQLETEKREAQEKERLALAQKLSMTCRSALDEEEDPDLAELLSDNLLLEFAQKRMQEMMEKAAADSRFGRVVHLKSGDEYLDHIDKEKPSVTIVLHVYENSVHSCKTMNECLDELARDFPCVKFCKISASTAGLSHNFKADGVPALLVYKAGELIGNFIQLGEEFGNEFVANDVENFLIDKGIVLSSPL